MTVFWCVLQNGRHNSVSTTNNIEAISRARALNAAKLFGKNLATGAVFSVSL